MNTPTTVLKGGGETSNLLLAKYELLHIHAYSNTYNLGNSQTLPQLYSTGTYSMPRALDCLWRPSTSLGGTQAFCDRNCIWPENPKMTQTQHRSFRRNGLNQIPQHIQRGYECNSPIPTNKFSSVSLSWGTFGTVWLISWSAAATLAKLARSLSPLSRSSRKATTPAPAAASSALANFLGRPAFWTGADLSPVYFQSTRTWRALA